MELTQAVADGYWLLLNPLPPGKHTIFVSADAAFPDSTVVGLKGPFHFEATYNLTVAPRGQVR